MSALTAAVRLDGMVMRPYARQLCLVIAAMGILVVVGGTPSVVLVTAGLFAALIVAYPFAVEDKNDLGTLHAVLPVRRGTLVLARYATAVLGYLGATVAATVLALVWASQSGEPVVAAELWLVAGASFAMFALLVALQLPVYYALGYTRGRIVGYVPIMLVSAGIGASGVIGSETMEAVDRWLTGASGTAAGLAFALGVLLLAASVVVSWRLDRRRALRTAARPARDPRD
jgi:hypothetical protein